MFGFPREEENQKKKSHFSEEQIVGALRDAEVTTVAVSARKHGVSEQSLRRWRKQFEGMQVSDVRELKRLREENNRLKKLLAERDLEVEVMKEIQEKNSDAKRTAGSGAERDQSRGQPASGRLVLHDTAFRDLLSVAPGTSRSPPQYGTACDCATGSQLGLSLGLGLFETPWLAR